ncbi:hypothetical protein KY335_03510 [Candidatus Woesearchaeota archaeon]|nr:hypothetical protein [Candidatus Woesearchaeota archaeon]
MATSKSLGNMPRRGMIVSKRKVKDGYMLTVKGERGKEYKYKVDARSIFLKMDSGWDGKLVTFNLNPDTGEIWNIRKQRR